MTQYSFFQQPIWTITEITHYIRELLEGDENLQDIWVQGEISNFTRASSGHLYFTLKDATSSLRCVMWKNNVSKLALLPKNGDAVQVHGIISVYEATGQYQLYVDWIRMSGEGELYQEFLRLKEKLETEGLFDPSKKRALPTFPKIIGIVTSPTGAALRDILDTIQRRYTLADIMISPSQVQGIDAPAQIKSAIEKLISIVKPDVIIIARGGGSIEDLWAFNDEGVARAIAASSIPIITGIGHETDFTIADFASDVRAPTPTAAAEIVTPNRMDLKFVLTEHSETMLRLIKNQCADRIAALDKYHHNLLLLSPMTRLMNDRQRLDDLLNRVVRYTKHHLQLSRSQFEGLRKNLDSLNPSSALQRGFSAVSLPDGTLVRSIHQVKPSDMINIRAIDGEYSAQVQDILEMEDKNS